MAPMASAMDSPMSPATAANVLTGSGDSIASTPSSLAASPTRSGSMHGSSGLATQFDNGDEHNSDDGAESNPDTPCAESPPVDASDFEPEISSPRQPQRSTLRAAFQLRKRSTSNTNRGASDGAVGDEPTSARGQRGSAGVTATLRSARNSEAPIDEDYVLTLLATPDLLNPAKMTADENRLFERLVVQLQLQLKSLTTPSTPRSATRVVVADH